VALLLPYLGPGDNYLSMHAFNSGPDAPVVEAIIYSEDWQGLTAVIEYMF
jgi:hypothetical protein